MATTYSDDGKTYTSGGITYDMSSGRAINSEGEYLTEVKKRQQVKDKDGVNDYDTTGGLHQH